jgi:acetyltransferase-like isoleucine patch superfamily enzyme
MMIRIEKYKDLHAEENVELIIGASSSFNGMRIHNDGVAKRTPRATVRIGRHFHSGKGCIIRTSDHDFSRGYPMVNGAISGYKSADVTIGDYVWIGDDVLIMKGVTIGHGAIIQARSVVVSDIPPLAIAGGHPCRVFSQRDSGEYEFFKSLNLGSVPADRIMETRADFEAKLAEFQADRANKTPPGN